MRIDGTDYRHRAVDGHAMVLERPQYDAAIADAAATSLVSDDVSVLEDLILAAHNDAKSKAEYEMNAKMQEMTAGLPLPPGMKFPF